jgi:hypothetical protein
MENTKMQLFIIVSICFLPIVFTTDIEASNSIIKNGHITDGKAWVKGTIYKDTCNLLYIKVKNRPILHPSQWGKQIEDSIYLEKIYFGKSYIELNKLLDPTTFRSINVFGSYWVDTAFIYVYRTFPIVAPQFFALPRGKETFYGTNKDFLLYDTTLYFYGDIVNDVNTTNLSILKLPKKTGKGYIEFLTDGKSVFFSQYKLDKERINDFTDLRDEDKLKIIKQYSLE